MSGMCSTTCAPAPISCAGCWRATSRHTLRWARSGSAGAWRVAGAAGALDRWGAGSGSARLIVGSRPVHRELETELAEWKAAEAALLFPTGFAANLGVMTTLATEDVLVVSDELNHASIIDGCR